MPPLKSPAAFHEQRRSLERARTEDYLKRKIRSRPERSELVRMHILEETSAEPSLQAKQLQLKRARLADDLNDKISHRPGPIELVHKNILSVNCTEDNTPPDSPKGAGGESSSLDEDSCDALSPDQLTNHDSPLNTVPQPSPFDVLTQNGDVSPKQFIPQPTPQSFSPPKVNGSDSPSPLKMTTGTTVTHRTPIGQFKSHSKTNSDRPALRSKKPKDNKPKVKKLKYHQYIPPDQKADKERPPQMDSSYAKLLQQQQLFLQLQILNQQQQQHYNYHTILPAPPKPAAEQTLTTNPGPSPSRSVPTTTNNNATPRQGQGSVGGAKPATLPANLDELKVAELKQELKLRCLTVSGTKNDLIERLRNYQEQNGTSAAVTKNGILHPIHQGAASAANAATSALNISADHQPAEGGFKVALSPLAQAFQGRVMRFGSTSSSPPVSPTPSERSLAGLSPDETSCNGDMFGEMVSSPLTQLTLHPSPQHPSNSSPLSQPVIPLKEEKQSSCSFHRPSEAQQGVTMDTSSLNKDQMLHEKDKQIEELTRMLRQKQRLVETLRSQLEQGKTVGGPVSEQGERVDVKPPTLIKASAIQPPELPNGLLVKVKQEDETEEGMTGIKEEAQTKKVGQPMQCSQETLLRLQQINRLQVQQAEQQTHRVSETKSNAQKQPEQKKVSQILLQQQQQQLQQQQLQQLIIQQTKQKNLQAQQRLGQQKLAQQLLQQTQGKKNQTQQKSPVQLKQVQVQIHNETVASLKPGANQGQQRKQLKAQQRQQQKPHTTTVGTQQVAPVFINQQNGTQIHTQAISLDLLKASGTPTLVTDTNGNHYLIALSGHTTDDQNQKPSLAKASGRITLQRLQSTPSKLPSAESQSQEQKDSQPIKKEANLHVDTKDTPTAGLSVTAPPNLQPFFDDMSESKSQSNLLSSFKGNGVNSQQMDDLFDILLKSGEITGFKANTDPSLAPLHSDPPSPSSPLRLSPQRPLVESCTDGGGRLEDFLESTTGAPLLGGGLTLIDDLHSQMLSSASILDHTPSPMDTSDMGFSPHSTGLDFGDPTLECMDWLDISMVGSADVGSGGSCEGEAKEGDGGTSLTPLAPHTPPSVFSADFLDSADLQLHWESCL
ncbi:myocardin related transcription factor Ab isoform X1 [Nerophis lumbriciformis]|uniref:myocardin related transcription factor Ab isoform X1 n=1 Tax=Nerophis lumbriciformis TaxID=546530 RepID=UPI002AE08957|nr:myocardin related transcription factor Ab isoform X1 [Nerophis lumbriciformis]